MMIKHNDYSPPTNKGGEWILDAISQVDWTGILGKFVRIIL